MNQRNMIVIAGIFWASNALAAGTVPAHTPEWSDRSTSNPGKYQRKLATNKNSGQETEQELTKVVDLCAENSESQEFKKSWGEYVNKHDLKGEALDETIDMVIDQAENRRVKTMAVGSAEEDKEWRERSRRTMRDAAEILNRLNSR